MDALSSAVLLMLACSPGAQRCSELRLSQTYATIDACRAALPDTLRKASQPSRPVIGRCVHQDGDPGIDPTVTGMVEADLATVRVTRIVGGHTTSSTYRVPKTAP
jgi:hypothetical protein